MRGAKGICPGVWKSHAPNSGPWGFPTWQETFPGQVVLGGALAETLWLLKECASVSPSLEQAGTFSAHSNLSTRWVRGLCWGAGCCTGARWEARLVGRVLGMLSAVREPSAPSWRAGSSHWSLPRGICYAGGVCCAVEHRGYHRESSMRGNPREKGTWPGCAHVLQQQQGDTSVP